MASSNCSKTQLCAVIDSLMRCRPIYQACKMAELDPVVLRERMKSDRMFYNLCIAARAFGWFDLRTISDESSEAKRARYLCEAGEEMSKFRDTKEDNAWELKGPVCDCDSHWPRKIFEKLKNAGGSTPDFNEFWAMLKHHGKANKAEEESDSGDTCKKTNVEIDDTKSAEPSCSNCLCSMPDDEEDDDAWEDYLDCDDAVPEEDEVTCAGCVKIVINAPITIRDNIYTDMQSVLALIRAIVYGDCLE